MSPPGVEYRRPRPGDMEELAAGLRRQDVAELRALGFDDPVYVIGHCVLLSHWCWAAHVGGALVCIFGVSREGEPWMLGTDLVKNGP